MRKLLSILFIVTLLSSFKKETYSPEVLLGKTEPTLTGTDYRLQSQVAKDFEKMKSAALKEGINMYSASSYRGYHHQKRIWNNKWSRYQQQGLKGLDIAKKIIEYSTIPGTSRHHWGTDFDVIDKAITNVKGDKLIARNYEQGGVYEKLGSWLKKNASSYGFELVYTNAPNRKGFKYEPWHLSHKSTSIHMYKEYQRLNWYNNLTNDVKGKEFFTKAFIEKYTKENIQDINPILK
ncbi:M15 family metallopeptidase [Cyclobacteriaceae bacterium]|nr:M15 family metallopeptidase [Cyclobacteriaceae bacterium]